MTTSTDLILPGTGELIALDTIGAALDDLTTRALAGSEDDLASVLDGLRVLDREIASLKRLISGEVAARSETIGKKTIHVGDGRSLVVKGGETTEVDAEGYERAIRRAGMPEDRVNEIVVTTVSKRVDLVKAKQAASANPKYARALKRHSTIRETPISVSIERS